jgi:hypothetical protein
MRVSNGTLELVEPYAFLDRRAYEDGNAVEEIACCSRFHSLIGEDALCSEQTDFGFALPPVSQLAESRCNSVTKGAFFARRCGGPQ